jgi:hypothetical protein
MPVFFYIGYLMVGFIQFFAIMDGVDFAFGISGFIGFIVAIFTTYIPLLGAGLGVYGAVNVWDWGFIQAFLLFFWYVPIFLIFVIFSK